MPPPTRRDWNAIAKTTAIWLADNGIAAADFVARSSWLYDALPYINAYLDGPKSLAELHDLALKPTPGYDIHHIVEQTPAERDGFPRYLIDRDDNLVRVPTFKHWEINAWFQTRNERYGGLSPRAYLRGKDWNTRRKIGLEVLETYGILKP